MTPPRKGREKQYATWKSEGRGSWACWFATERHSVTELTSGYRYVERATEREREGMEGEERRGLADQVPRKDRQ
jgi:hypothetical protein